MWQHKYLELQYGIGLCKNILNFYQCNLRFIAHIVNKPPVKFLKLVLIRKATSEKNNQEILGVAH